MMAKAVMLGSAALNSLFVSYYLDFYVNVVGVSTWSFFVVQILFMLWNAMNDPLFGWIGDHFTGEAGTFDRAEIVRYGGVVWCLAFCVVWWAPSAHGSSVGEDSGTHWNGVGLSLYFLGVLCLYDSALTIVEVNHTALLGELTTDVATRARYNACAACLAACGSLSSLWSHMVWDRSAMLNFRIYSLVVAAIAFGAFQFAAKVFSKPRRGIREAHSVLSEQPGKNTSKMWSKTSFTGLFGKLKNDTLAAVRSARTHGNLRIFLSVNFLQCFDCCFEKNFFGIWLDLLAGSISPFARSTVLSLSFILPWVGAILLTPVVERYGVQNAIARIFRVRTIICSVGLIALVALSMPGAKTWLGETFLSVAFVLYLLANRVSSECVCRLQPLAISDLADEDAYLRETTKNDGGLGSNGSRRGVVVGISGILGKFATSLAPIMGVVLLSVSGHGSGELRSLASSLPAASSKDPPRVSGADFSDAGSGNGIAPTFIDQPLDSKAVVGDGAAFRYALIFVPGICVLIQQLWWNRYSLHGSYLEKVKAFIEQRQGGLP